MSDKIQMILMMKTDRLQKDRRVVHRVTTSGTTSDNEWQRVVQQVTRSGTTSDNEWYNEWQRVTASEKEWQRMVISDSEWEQWYSEWKLYGTLQRMDDCDHFNDNFNFNGTTT